MPEISLVVCVHAERELLARLLKHAAGCYSKLIVVHDGCEVNDFGGGVFPKTLAKKMALDYSTLPADGAIPQFYSTPASPVTGSVHELVVEHGGRYFEGPSCYQQEPHWPFAWSQTDYDWILRIDADEFPSADLKDWLSQFRKAAEPDQSVSGYTCIWPLWNGSRALTKQLPAGRIFLFNKKRVRFFGMVEQVPIADGRFEALPLALEHRPLRKSYGLSNLLLRKQAYDWRRNIALSLLGKPTDLQCWRWRNEEWPEIWEDIRRKPLRTGFYRLIMWSLRSMRDFWCYERKLIPSAAVCGGLHHCLITLVYWRLRRRKTVK